MFQKMNFGNRILLLPREIQVEILKHLSAAELSVLERFKSWKELVLDKQVVKKTDVCGWKHKKLKDVWKYLAKTKRSSHIRELCLNNLRIPDSFFTYNKYYHLYSLHIVNCNIQLDELVVLLMHVSFLEDLSWSLSYTASVCGRYEIASFERMKTFYVECYLHGNSSHHEVLLLVLGWFVNLECLNVHFSTIHRTIVGGWPRGFSHRYRTHDYKNLHSLVCTSDSSFSMLENNPTITAMEMFVVYVEDILTDRGTDRPWKNLWFGQINASSGMDVYPVIQEETTVIGLKEATIKNVQLQPVMGGPKVKILLLDACQFGSNVNQDECLNRFFSASRNITELNLFNTHFDQLSSPCVLISTLHSIKKLLLPLCGIFSYGFDTSSPDSGCSTSNTDHQDFPPSKRVCRENSRVDDGPLPLDRVVEGCPRLTDLDVRQFGRDASCSVCRGAASWEYRQNCLYPIHRMRNLRTLTLVGLQVNYMQRGTFFDPFHESLKELTRLRLYFIGLQGHQNYWPSLSSALPTLTSLRDISIQHSTLPLASTDFWNVFSKVRGLERLCLVSNFSGRLPVEILKEFIQQVPKLYVLHIHSRAVNFKVTMSGLRRLIQDGKPNCNPQMEIVIQHFSVHVNLNSRERIEHEGNAIHKKELCVPGTDIAQLIRKCGMQSIL